MLQVDPIQSYMRLKIGLPPVLKAGSSGTSFSHDTVYTIIYTNILFHDFTLKLIHIFKTKTETFSEPLKFLGAARQSF